jgi:hypothetical protein
MDTLSWILRNIHLHPKHMQRYCLFENLEGRPQQNCGSREHGTERRAGMDGGGSTAPLAGGRAISDDADCL